MVPSTPIRDCSVKMAPLVMAAAQSGAGIDCGHHGGAGAMCAGQGRSTCSHSRPLEAATDAGIHRRSGSPGPHGDGARAARRWGKQDLSGFADNPRTSSRRRGEALRCGGAPRGRVEFLISEIERHPGEVTILAIGPMTISRCAADAAGDRDQDCAIVFIGRQCAGGGNASPRRSLTFWFDPRLRALCCGPHSAEGDVCPGHCNTRRAEGGIRPDRGGPDAIQIYSAKIWQPLSRLYEASGSTGYMWDSLAAAYLLDPGS